MSVLEKKALAFEKLAALQTEQGIDEILAHLDKLNNAATSFNLSKNLDAISQRYDETLKKLAQ